MGLRFGGVERARDEVAGEEGRIVEHLLVYVVVGNWNPRRCHLFIKLSLPVLFLEQVSHDLA